jgi:predicted CoA-binding protein
MSEERMMRIEALLTTIQADMASVKADIAPIKGETAAEIEALRPEIATADNLSELAKNIDVVTLSRQMRELLAVKEDLKVVTAVFWRLKNTISRRATDLAEMRAEHSRMDGY